MISKIVDEIKKNKHSYIADAKEIAKVAKLISDQDYLKFLESTNGGKILKSSLKFYGVLPNDLESEIFYNNYLFKKYFDDLVSGVFVFGEDLFGNQYGFLDDGKIVFINIETASFEFTLDNFADFAVKLFDDLDYFSGFSVMEKWSEKFGYLDDYKRLSPKKPFVVGGGYEIENFFELDKEKLFDFNSYLAKQIKDLPDGTRLNFQVE